MWGEKSTDLLIETEQQMMRERVGQRKLEVEKPSTVN